MSEKKGTYETEAKEALEMLGKGYETRVKDESGDKKYFTITPRIVKSLARNAHDFAVWDTIKDIAGENGECYLNTEQIAILSGCSTGQVSDSRRYWLKVGFLKGEVRKDPGYSQAVWHLSIPDIWQINIQWCEEHPKIADRLAFRIAHKSLHRMKPSPTEGKPSPTETKKNLVKKNNKNLKPAATPKPPTPPEILIFREVTKLYPPKVNWDSVVNIISSVSKRLGRPATADDLRPFFAEWTFRGFKPTNINWTSWAVTGEIPQQYGKPKQVSTTPKPVELPADKLEELRKKALSMFFPDQQEVTA